MCGKSHLVSGLRVEARTQLNTIMNDKLVYVAVFWVVTLCSDAVRYSLGLPRHSLHGLRTQKTAT